MNPRRAAVTIAMWAVVAACAPDPSDVAPASTGPATSAPQSTVPALPAGIGVEVEYVPNLALLRRLEVSVDNTTSADVTISELGVRSAWFDAVPSTDIGTVVGAGRRRDMEVLLGDAVCPAEPGPTLVDVGINGSDGPAATVVDFDDERLAELNAKECGQRAVFERADITFGSRRDVVDDVLTTTIDIVRRDGTQRIGVTDVGGTLLFSIRPQGADGALARLDPEDTAAALPLRLEVHRCDAHTVSQSQLSYRFPVWVTIDDADPQYVIIEPDPELRAVLEELVQACIARETAG